MSTIELLAQIPLLDPDQRAALRRALGVEEREVPGSGERPAGYEELFGSMSDEPALEIPERHHWRPAPKLD